MSFDLCRRNCVYYRDAAVFELCEHPKSEYVIQERKDVHTIAHMRMHESLCGESAKLLKRKS